MGLISDKDREFLVGYFAKEMKDQVEVSYYTQHDSTLMLPTPECMYCKETRELLEEVASLSDKIQLKVHDFVTDEELAKKEGVDKIPAIILTGKNKGKIRFFGIPSGYEFSSLIEVLVDLSKGTTTLSDVTKAELAKVTEDLHIQVFVTPTWPYCPNAARMAQRMAMESEHVIADVVEASEFPQLSQKYRVMSVPKIVVNEKTQFVGALPEERYLAEVKKAIGKK